MKFLYKIGLFACLLISTNAFSQKLPPVIEWQKSLGGSKLDKAYSVIRTLDKGYLVVGKSFSNDGNVTGHHGSTDSSDAWVIKLDKDGSIVWQRSYGGSRHDEFIHAIAIGNGDFICVGSTESKNGDVTGLHGSPADLWAVRIDRNGNIIWSKVYGGTDPDHAQVIRKAVDGGYVIAGDSESADGDLTNHFGYADIWLLKINDNGVLQWQKKYGNYTSQFTTSMIVTSDSCYVISGYQKYRGGQSCTSPVYSWYEEAYLKIDKQGNAIWENYPFFQCGNPGMSQFSAKLVEMPSKQLFYIGNRGNASTQNYPYWLFKRVYANGQATFYSLDYPFSNDEILPPDQFTQGPETAEILPDSSILICNTVIKSGARNGTLTRVNTKDTIGRLQFYYRQWYGVNSIEYFTGITVLNESEYVAAGINSSNNGNVWVVKFRGLNKITGHAFLDNNKNGIKDAAEPWFTEGLVQSNKPGFSKTSSLTNGYFSNEVDTGTYTTSVVFNKPYYASIPVSKQTSFTTYSNTDTIVFAVQPISGKKDYYTGLYAMTPARPGFNVRYGIQYGNAGTDTLNNGLVRIVKDSRLTFVSSVPAPSSITADTIIWNVNNLKPGEEGFINLLLKATTALSIGDTLVSTTFIDTTGDLIPSNNTSILRQIVTGSFDPNDKVENAGNYFTLQDISSGKVLTYTIRFQNTGTDTAFNVIVRDTLESKLDWNSIEMVAASHPFQLSIKDGRYATWTFENILLPDSNRNEPASHGYIVFGIKPKSTLSIGDTIKNSASIYFDFNLPVKTNTQLTVVKLAPPDQPVVTGIANNYCSNQGLQKGKISNLPAAGSGTTATVKLDGNSLIIAADSSFSFDVSSLSAGAHSIVITFSNSTATKTTTINFNTTAAVTPDVNVSANITTILNLATPVIVTATNAIGGGSTPLYSFAKDRSFSNILQAEGSNNTITINANTLTLGDNWIYVRMKTSATCYTSQTNIDSIKLVRDQTTGIIDTDFPNSIIGIYPNPFNKKISVDGLSVAKTYTIMLHSLQGQMLYKKSYVNRSNIEVTNFNETAGTYILSIYDEKKKRTLGTVKILKQ